MDASFYQGVAVSAVAIAVAAAVQVAGTIVTARADRKAREADHQHRLTELDHQRRAEVALEQERERADAVERALDAVSHARDAVAGLGVGRRLPSDQLIAPEILAALNRARVGVSMHFRTTQLPDAFANAYRTVAAMSRVSPDGIGGSVSDAHLALMLLTDFETALMDEFDRL